LIRAISLVPVRKTMRRSVRNLSRLLTTRSGSSSPSRNLHQREKALGISTE
jgi:predicted component of type VI protein secretion system